MGWDEVDEYSSDNATCESLMKKAVPRSAVPQLLINDRASWLERAQRIAHHTPYFLIDPSQSRRNTRFLQTLLPDIAIHYALKSNPDAAIINAIDDIVAGYDIASAGEMRALKDIGVAPERMLYSNPVKVPRHLQETYRAGVRHFAFDSLDEIAKIAEYAPGSNVYVRIKVSDLDSEFPLSRKFGIPADTALKYMLTARTMGLNPMGITFHVGSQCTSTAAWEEAIRSAGSLIEDLAQHDIAITMLDIGGGIPHCRSYAETKHVITITSVIRTCLSAYIPAEIMVVMEPGRFISTTAGLLATQVIGRETRGDEDWLFVDMGVFQGLMEPLELAGWTYPAFTDSSKIGPLHTFVLTGPTCDAYDTIGLAYALPSDVQVGDIIYLSSVGSYSKVYGSTFNGFDVPNTYYTTTKTFDMERV